MSNCTKWKTVRDNIRKQYGSYLATAVFEKERKLLARINNILLYRYGHKELIGKHIMENRNMQ